MKKKLPSESNYFRMYFDTIYFLRLRYGTTNFTRLFKGPTVREPKGRCLGVPRYIISDSDSDGRRCRGSTEGRDCDTLFFYKKQKGSCIFKWEKKKNYTYFTFLHVWSRTDIRSIEAKQETAVHPSHSRFPSRHGILLVGVRRWFIDLFVCFSCISSVVILRTDSERRTGKGGGTFWVHSGTRGESWGKDLDPS